MGRPTKQTPDRQARPIVYLMWAAHTDIFKIGYTTGLIEQRHKAVQSMSPIPLYVIATMDGSRADEASLHREWGSYRNHGEWFVLNDDDGLLCLLKAYGVLQELDAELSVSADERRHPGWRVVLWLAAQRLKRQANSEAHA